MANFWSVAARLGLAAGTLCATALGAASAFAQTPPGSDLRDDQYSVAYQINPAHTGSITFDQSFKPPLKVLWNDTAEGLMSYPLIARGKVFVWVSHFSNLGGQHTGRLYALDGSSGSVIWQVDVATTYGDASIAYDAGQIFLVTVDDIAEAFDADSGGLNWKIQLSQAFSFTPPTAANGVLYTVGTGSGGTLYAVDEASGALLWSQPVENGDNSPPTLSGEGVFLSYPCQVYDFNPVTGAPIWHFAGNCEGGGGSPTTYYRGHLYVSQELNITAGLAPASIFDTNTGQISGTFGVPAYGPPQILGPSFQGRLGYFSQNGISQNGILTAISITSGKTVWSFSGDPGLYLPPIVVNDSVYTFSRSGTLYAFDRVSGNQIWIANAGAIPMEYNGVLVTGMAAGEGILVVPAGRQLYALVPDDSNGE